MSIKEKAVSWKDSIVERILNGIDEKSKLSAFFRKLHSTSNKQLGEGNIEENKKNSKPKFSEKLNEEYPINDEHSTDETKIEQAEKDNSRLYNESIILIGPSGAGKSTVAEELRKITRMPRLSLDRIANQNRRSGYMKKFKNVEEHHIHMIKTELERAKSYGKPGIVDFGAGHSVYDDPEKFNELKKMLSKFKNIVLLLPSVDIKKSLEIMEKRSTGDTRDNKKFLTSLCNRELATITIYGEGITPNDIANEIVNIIKDREKGIEKTNL